MRQGANSHSKERLEYEAGKRIVDLIASSTLLLILSPVISATAFSVLITSGRPVVFRQARLTKGGRVFTLLKFRTMRTDAEAGTGAVWAQEKDPRVTSIGRFLRVTRLDELPQLVNVLSGDMSLIGPRPERPEIAEELRKQFPSFHRRLEVKAGITGLAQVYGGYASSIESYRQKLALDLLYIKRRSIALDTVIAIRTVLVILTGSGAR